MQKNQEECYPALHFPLEYPLMLSKLCLLKKKLKSHFKNGKTSIYPTCDTIASLSGHQ